MLVNQIIFIAILSSDGIWIPFSVIAGIILLVICYVSATNHSKKNSEEFMKKELEKERFQAELSEKNRREEEEQRKRKEESIKVLFKLLPNFTDENIDYDFVENIYLQATSFGNLQIGEFQFCDMTSETIPLEKAWYNLLSYKKYRNDVIQMVCNVIYSWNSECKFKGEMCDLIISDIRSAITIYPPNQEEIEGLIGDKETWEQLTNEWAAKSGVSDYDGDDFPYFVSEKKMKAYSKRKSNK